MTPVHAFGAALSWAALTGTAVIVVCGVFLTTARAARGERTPEGYWVLVVLLAVIGANVAGFVALTSGLDYFWRIP